MLSRINVPGTDTIYVINEYNGIKTCDASDGSYHYRFNQNNGNFQRWGHNEADDPQWCPAGPEILDLEISINGCPNNCAFCYKGNSSTPATNMTLNVFKGILKRMMIPAKEIELEDGRKIITTGPVKLKNGKTVNIEDLKVGDDVDI